MEYEMKYRFTGYITVTQDCRQKTYLFITFHVVSTKKDKMIILSCEKITN